MCEDNKRLVIKACPFVSFLRDAVNKCLFLRLFVSSLVYLPVFLTVSVLFVGSFEARSER
jgi:hypothetical protein